MDQIRHRDRKVGYAQSDLWVHRSVSRQFKEAVLAERPAYNARMDGMVTAGAASHFTASSPLRRQLLVVGWMLAALCLTAPIIRAQTYNFIPTSGDQVWSTPGNWDATPPPDRVGAVANIPSPTANEKLSLDRGFTIGTLNIVNNSSSAVFTLDPGTSNNYLRMNDLSYTPMLVISGTNATPGNVKIDANLNLDGGQTLTIENDNVSNTTSATVIFTKGIVRTNGTSDLIKAGNGWIALNAVSTYTGMTTIQAGILSLGIADALQTTSQITINNGGTLLLQGVGPTDRINNRAAVTLAGGTFNTGGTSERDASGVGVGALTLTSNSVLDLGNGTSRIAFGASAGIAWSQGSILSIYNWTGSATGGGMDGVFVGTNGAGLSTDQLGSIRFYSDSGTTLLGKGSILTTGEIVPTPVPEPATLAVGAFMLGMICKRFLRREQ